MAQEELAAMMQKIVSRWFSNLNPQPNDEYTMEMRETKLMHQSADLLTEHRRFVEEGDAQR